jgi:hypothetical protein
MRSFHKAHKMEVKVGYLRACPSVRPYVSPRKFLNGSRRSDRNHISFFSQGASSPRNSGVRSILRLISERLILGLFNDTFSTSEGIQRRKIGLWMINWKGGGRKRSWPISRYCPRILLEGLKKTTKTRSRGNPSSGSESHPEPLKYKAGIPPPSQWLSMESCPSVSTGSRWARYDSARCLQNFYRKTWRKETTQKTQA